MSRAPSLNGEFMGTGRPRFGPDRPRHGNARPITPDRAEVEECRRILGQGPIVRMVEEIEGYGFTAAEELGAQRDLELWGDDPFGGL